MTIGMPKFGSPQAAMAAAAQRIRCTLVGNFTLTGGATVDVPWAAETYKFGITHDVAVNNERIVIVTAGRYLTMFTATAVLTNAVAAGQDAIEAMLSVNGLLTSGSSAYRPLVANAWVEDTSTAVTLVVSSVLDLAAGDIVRAAVHAPTQVAGNVILLQDGITGPTAGATHIDIHRL